MNDTEKIVADIIKLDEANKRVIIAIDGRSGSGKTFFAESLPSKLPNARVVHLDQFDMYKGDPSIQMVIDEVIKPFKSSKDNQILILDGIFSLSSKFDQYTDYKIWIEYPADLGYKRGLERDRALNGIDNSDKWINYWLPKEEEYVTNENPQKKANHIINI